MTTAVTTAVSARPAPAATPVARRTGAQLVRFAVVGAAGTATYLGLFLLLRPALGAQAAGAAARVLPAVPTTWLHGRVAFGSRTTRRRLHAGAAAALGLGLLVSAGALALDHALVGPQRSTEVLALAAATVVSTGARFLLLRQWVFRPVRPGSPARGACGRGPTR